MASSEQEQAVLDTQEAPQKRHWSIWLARLAMVFGIITVGIALLGAIGAGEGWWSQADGMRALTFAFFLGVLGLFLGFLVFVYYRRMGRRILLVTLLSLVLSGGYIGYISYHIVKARSLPFIHDVSTDLQNPPRFVALQLRADNLANIPGRGEPEFSGMDAFERWQKIHGQGYPDIVTLRVKRSVADVIAAAEAYARGRGWEIASVNADQGRLEATDTVSLLKFKDDVVVRVQPDDAGDGAIVDIRSVSRYGQSDIGVNARRVRAMLAALEAELK